MLQDHISIIYGQNLTEAFDHLRDHLKNQKEKSVPRDVANDVLPKIEMCKRIDKHN